MSIRDTDDPWEKPSMPPLGHPEPREKPQSPEWVPVPDSPNVERHVVTGRLRTRIPRNDLANGWWPLCK